MNNFQIAALLSKVTFSNEEKEQAASYLKNISSDAVAQEKFFNYCKIWKLAPWICSQLKKHNLFHLLSVHIQEQFNEIHLKIKEENEKRNREAVRFLKKFKEENIDVIVLKGNLFAHTVYQETGYKRMNDFDILVRQENWEKVQDIYFNLGYIPLGFGWSGEKQKAAKFSHVGMSFISPDFTCIVGTQWGLKSPTTNFNVPIEEAWQTAGDFNFNGVLVKQLSPAFNILHLVLHMGIYKCGIRDMMDVYNVLITSEIDEDELIRLIQKSNTVNKAYFTFHLSSICSTSLKPILNKLSPHGNSFTIRRLKKRLLVNERTGDIHNSYNDYFQDVEKIVIYFNLFPQFHKKLFLYFKILKSIYLPKIETSLKFIDKSDQAGIINITKARIKAPYFVFSLIAQEIGWKFTILLFLKLFIDLLLSFKNYFIKKESYFDYLTKRGIDPKTIEKVVKNIQ